MKPSYEDLQRENRELKLQNQHLIEKVENLEKKIQDLLDKLNTSSKNSSKPPSQDPNRKINPKKSTGKKQGAQPGHQGHHRGLVDESEVDESHDVCPSHCHYCGGGDFDSEKGEVYVERILSVIGTMKKQGKNAYEYLSSCFNAFIRGSPIPTPL